MRGNSRPVSLGETMCSSEGNSGETVDQIVQMRLGALVKGNSRPVSLGETVL